MIWRRPIVPAMPPPPHPRPDPGPYREGFCAHGGCDERVTDPGLWVYAGRDYCSPTCARLACGSY